MPHQSVVAPSGERLGRRLKVGMVLLAGKTVWSMPGRLRLNSTQRLFANIRKYRHNNRTPNGRLPERPKPI